MFESGTRLTALLYAPRDAPCPDPVRYAYRAFDRQWVLPDARLGDFMRPALWRISGPRQVFLTSMLTNVLGAGPAAVVTALVPDLDHFRGSFGARGVIPLWRDSAATEPNVSQDWLRSLSQQYGFEVSAPALLAYCYALLSARSYRRRFEEELRTPGPHVPMTADVDVFLRGVALGQKLIGVHTYRDVIPGNTKVVTFVGTAYPHQYSWCDGFLSVGEGQIGPVQQAVWEYSVSGYRVVPGWLRRRITPRKKSTLDEIRPDQWTRDLTHELLELLWLLEATLAVEPALDALLDAATSGSHINPLIAANAG